MVEPLDRITGKLTEAVHDPNCWTAALDCINAFVNGSGAVLLSVDERLRHAPTSSDLTEMISDYFLNGWYADDRRERCVPLLRSRGLVTDYQFQEVSQIENCGFYNDFLAKHDRKWFAGVGANLDGNLWCLALQRSPAKGPYVSDDLLRLQAVQKRLSQSAALSRLVSQSWISGAFNSLDMVPCGAVTLDRNGRVCEMNDVARAILKSNIDRKGRLELGSVLQDILHSRRTNFLSHQYRLQIGLKQFRIELQNIRQMPIHVFSKASLLVLITLARRNLDEEMTNKYALTTKEAIVAMALFSGNSVSDIADQKKVTVNTVRKHLKSLYHKTGTGSQAKLVSLMATISAGEQQELL